MTLLHSRRADLPPKPTTALIGRVQPARAGSAVVACRSARSLRRVRRIGGGLFIALLAIGITSLSSPEGSIAHADGVCIDSSESNTWGPDGVRTGVDGMIGQAGPSGGFDDDTLPGGYSTIDEAVNDTGYTDYEKLGTAGTLFSVDYGSQDSDDNACFPVAKIVGNFLANSLFNISKVIARVAISTYQWSTNPGILDPLNEPLDDATAAFWDGGLQYLLGAAILLGVGTVLWLTLVRRRFSLGLGGVVWMVVATAGLLVFLAQPSWLASKVNQTTAELSNFTFGGVGTSVEKQDPHVAATYAQIRTEPNATQRIASDMMWRVMVWQPWLAGQWGTGSNAPIYMTTSPYPSDTPPGWYDGTRDARYQQLYSQACVLDPAVSICDQRDDLPNAPDIAAGSVLSGAFVNQYAQSWYMVENWTCTSADYCIGPVGNPDNGDDDDEREVDSSNGWQYRAIWSGDQPEQRMLAALTALVATVSLGLIIFILAAVVICYDLVLYLLLFLGAFLLILGIQPTWGRRLVTSLVALIAQNGMKRVMAGVLVSLLVVVYGIIQSTALGWAQQVGLMIGIGVAVLLVRRPLLAAVSGLGDSGTFGGVADNATEQLTQAGRRGTTTAMRRGGTVTAAAAGHAAAAPAKTRYGVIGARQGAEIARERAKNLAAAGTPLTAGQQRRTSIAATVAGAKAGVRSDNRLETERNATRFTGAVVASRVDRYEREANRKSARTDHGRTVTAAQGVKASERAAQVRAEKLHERDEAIRVAAIAHPRRFGGTAQTFDGYAAAPDGQLAAEYVDRNTRRPTGAGSGHHEHGDEPILRGSDTPPPPGASVGALRSAPAWKPDEAAARSRRRAAARTSSDEAADRPDVAPRVLPRGRSMQPEQSAAAQHRERLKAARLGTADLVNSRQPADKGS